MKDDQYDNILLRLSVASLFASVSLQVAREMYSKSYFALGQGEKIAVDQAAFGLVAGNYQATTEEALRKVLGGANQPQNAVGFVPPSSKQP